MKIFNIITATYLFLATTIQAEPFSSTALHQYTEQLNHYPIYHYPYPELGDQLVAEGKQSLSLFIYGSLIDEKSALNTLSKKALSGRRPALAFGYKRVFNRDIPLKLDSRFGLPCNGDARGMLNVIKTEHPENFLNGVLIDIPIAELPALMKREIGYNLVPVVVADWNSFLEGNVIYSIAYILQAPVGSVYVNSSILPRPGYYELTRNAARQYGPFYEILWLNSTYMADGITPVIMWEKRLNTQDAQVCHDNT